MHPNVAAEFIGPRWLCVLASSLAVGEHGIDTVDDAMNLCYAMLLQMGSSTFQGQPDGKTCLVPSAPGFGGKTD